MDAAKRTSFGRATGAARLPAESADTAEAGPGVVVFRRSGWKMAFAWAVYAWPLIVAVGLVLADWLGSDPDGYPKAIIAMVVCGLPHLALPLFIFRRCLFTERSPFVLRPEGVQLSLVGSEKIHPWTKVRLFSAGPLWLTTWWVSVEDIGEDDLVRFGPFQYGIYRFVKRVAPKRAATNVFLQLPQIYSPGEAEVYRLFKEYKAAAPEGDA